MDVVEYKAGVSYTGYEKGSVFDFTVNRIVDGFVFYLKRDDEDEENVYGLEDLQKWTKEYYDYLKS